MGTRKRATGLLVVAVLLLLTTASGALAAPVTTTTEAAPPPTTTTTRPPTTTTTRPATTTTRPATSTTAAPTTVPPTTSAPTTTPTTIRDEDDAPILTEEEEESTTTSTAPEPQVIRSAPVQVVFEPGEPVQIVAESDTAFDPDDEPTVTLSSNGDDATTVEIEVVASVDEDGKLVIDVVVPEDTPESIITVTITAVDSRGVTRTLVYLFPVRGASTTSTTESDALSARPAALAPRSWSELPVVPASEVPAIVTQIQAAIPDDATEQALLAELDAEPESVLTVDIDDAALAVSVRPVDQANGTARGLVAALALGLASLGLISLRRRAESVQPKGSR